MIKPYNILFLSSGSACRSQIARGWCNWYGRPLYDVQSAGISASGVDEAAITVMKEIGIDISCQNPEAVTEDMLKFADIVVILCPVADEQYPSLPAGVRREFWSLACPAITDTMSEHDRLQAYRCLRDDIKTRVIDLIARLNTLHYQSFQPFPRPVASLETAGIA